MTQIDTTKHQWIYIRHYNRFGDLQGVLFDTSRSWDDIKMNQWNSSENLVSLN